MAGRQDATPGRARRARVGRPLWGQLASPAKVSGGGAQIRAPPPPPRRTGAGQRAEVVVGRRAEVEAGRCAGAGLPPGAGQRARARSRAEEGDGGGEEDGVAKVEAGHAPRQGLSCRSKLAARAGGEVGRSAGEGAAPLRLRRGPHWMFASSLFGEAEMPSDSPSTQNAYPVRSSVRG